MMDRIGGVAGRFETSSQTFCFPVHRQMSESWLAMGKKCRMLALRVVHISLVLWAMYSQSPFLLRSEGKAWLQYHV